MNERDDLDIEKLTRAALERDADGLDAVTTARLAAARRRALDDLRSKRHWQPLAGWAVAASVVLAVSLWWWQSPRTGDVSADDFEMLVSSERLDLYEDLDFYAWLGSQDDATHDAAHDAT